jgi:4-hydroxybenzoyl-CoA thioesterase
VTTTHSLTYTVTFGDCDPAGIVFYPNIYGWFDRTFHDWLAGFGGHQAICAELGAIGLGLMQADAKFRRPMQPNDTVTITMTVRDWGRKALVLGYEVTMGETVMATGEEVRGMFKRTEQGLSAGEMAALKALLER